MYEVDHGHSNVNLQFYMYTSIAGEYDAPGY